MRKIVLSAWQEVVRAEMARRLPAFIPWMKISPGEWPRLLKYQSIQPGGMHWWIAFRPLDEQFDVYVGWSRNRQLSFSGLVQVAEEAPIETIAEDGVVLPTAMFAGRNGPTYWSFWDPPDEVVGDPARFAAEFANYYTKVLTDDEARDLVVGPVTAAIDEIVDYCIPYLESKL
jgi:hypothetical protein